MKKRKTNKAKRVSKSCRNNGTCEACKSNRTYGNVKRLMKANFPICHE